MKNNFILTSSPLDHSLQELINEVVVSLATHTLVFQTNVVGICQQLVIISTNIQDYGQALARGNATHGSVEGEFTHRDAHAKGSQVTQSKNTFSICYHNGLHTKSMLSLQAGEMPWL